MQGFKALRFSCSCVPSSCAADTAAPRLAAQCVALSLSRAAWIFIIITITMCANLKMTISRSMSTYPSDSKNLCLIDDDDDDLDYSWIEDFVVKRSSFTDEKSSLSPWPTLIWLSLLSYGNHDLTVAKHYDFLLFCRILYFQVNLFIRLKKFVVDWQQEYRVCHILLSTFLVFIWRILY